MYYISPQLWAHGPWRVKKIRKLVDRMVVIYPFEEAFYASEGVSVKYVGHPLFDELHTREIDEVLVGRLKDGEGKRLFHYYPEAANRK
jgi:lipid-A-disaccharide synthase